MKKCTKCNKFYPLSRFKKDKKRKDGASSWCKKCHSKSVVEYQKENPDKVYANKKRYQIRQYGIDDQDYLNMYNSQSGLCFICEKEFEVLCIDHCHKTGSIRGLLCKNCNSGIGFLKDNAFLISKAFVYLFQHVSSDPGKMMGLGYILGYFKISMDSVEFKKSETSYEK